MSEWLIIGLVSFFGAVLSGMGMGGGGILLIYLTAYAGMDQLAAQGINLVFFVPVAAVSLFIHLKNRLVRWRILGPVIILGFVGVYLGAKLAMLLGSDILSKMFGGLLLIIGLRELFAKQGKAGKK
jgi:uncharacterized membrane protein YfcA